ncbi:MAG: hypothetical protein ACKVHQ_03565 [Gammaproteobacteria bacterium]
MQLIFKYYGELTSYFSEGSEDNMIRIDIDVDDSVYSIFDKYNIPRDKINLVLVNGINVNHEDCEAYRFTDGDTLAVWAETAG